MWGRPTPHYIYKPNGDPLSPKMKNISSKFQNKTNPTMALRSLASSATAAAAAGRRMRPRSTSCLDTRWGGNALAIAAFERFHSSNASSDAPEHEQQIKEIQDGAWTLLAALEKAREAEGVRVSRLVSSLEALLPRPSPAVGASGHLPNLDLTSHSSDPAFFRLADPTRPTAADIAELLQSTRRGRRIDLLTIESLIQTATAKFRDSPSIVTLPPLTDGQKLHVIGDLHGSLSDLEAVLGLTGQPSANNLLLFNGDLADRGDNGIEIISTVCALSLAFPEYVFVNRGNHEDLALSVAYGLSSELQFKYGPTVFRERLAQVLDDFFMSLPLATVIEDDAFVVHAGPPPPGIPLEMLQQTYRWDDCGISRTIRTDIDHSECHWDQNVRFESLWSQDHAVEEIIESMTWSDPDIDEQDGVLVNSTATSRNKAPVWSPNVSRGAGYRFDAEVVRRFLNGSGLKRLIRSHEPVQNGCARYEILDETYPKEFFTVFSASRYPYKEGFNYGAVLTLSSNLKHRIVRYATEDDDPVGVRRDAEHIQTAEKEMVLDTVDSVAIRRTLRAAIATRRSSFERELAHRARWRGEEVETLPFDDTIDALFGVLNLRGERLLQEGPRRALAVALQPDLAPDELPTGIDILQTLDSFAREDRRDEDCVDFTEDSSSWLQAVFALIDVSHEGWISLDEWRAAVDKVNNNLPPGATMIDADETFDVLDQNGDGRLSPNEWQAIGQVICR